MIKTCNFVPESWLLGEMWGCVAESGKFNFHAKSSIFGNNFDYDLIYTNKNI